MEMKSIDVPARGLWNRKRNGKIIRTGVWLFGKQKQRMTDGKIARLPWSGITATLLQH
jgi:hypothetical protein